MYNFHFIICVFLIISTSCAFNSISTRKGKIWPFILPFYRRTIIPRIACIGNNLDGICMSKLQCESTAGIPVDRCSNNKGVCCAFVKSCGSSTNSNVTYFTNPEFPSPRTSGGMCQLTINKMQDDVCQLRLKFLQFKIAMPDAAGYCNDDFLSLGTRTTPIICGDNNEKIVYVDFDPNCAFHQITIDTTSSLSNFQRFWNIEITQIPCGSKKIAPSGCLMYFSSTSGSVSSFNYNGNPITQNDLNNYQLNNLNYGVCVKPAVGYCEIEWSASSEDSFSVSGNTTAGSVSVSGSQCNSSFIIIPNPIQDLVELTSDRFCGTAFQTVRSKSQPYVLTVKTAIDQTVDSGNRGFELNFRQILCA